MLLLAAPTERGVSGSRRVRRQPCGRGVAAEGKLLSRGGSSLHSEATLPRRGPETKEAGKDRAQLRGEARTPPSWPGRRVPHWAPTSTRWLPSPGSRCRSSAPHDGEVEREAQRRVRPPRSPLPQRYPLRPSPGVPRKERWEPQSVRRREAVPYLQLPACPAPPSSFRLLCA